MDVWEAVRQGRGCGGREGAHLQSLVATAQWVAQVVAWKKQLSKSNGFSAALTSLVKLYL